MKKLACTFLTLLLVLTCASVLAERSDLTTMGFRVASLNATNAHGWRSVYDAQLREVAEAYKAEGIISEYQEFCPQNDSATEVQMFETCINEGYDIILINAIGSSGLDACFEAAEEAGILVVPVDNLYPWENSIGVQTNQFVWAGNACRYLCEALGGEGKILQFNGQVATTGSSVRADTWTEVLADYPDIEVVYYGAHGWSQTESKVLMAEVLASGIEFDGILTEEACVGILEAIEEAGAAYPKAMTSDEEIGYLRMLDRINADEKTIDFYIIENPPGIGATALKLAVRMKAGWEWNEGVLVDGTDDNLVYYYEPTLIVTQDGIEGISLAEAIEMTKDMDDTDQVSAYITEDVANACFAE
jgi:ribose transport system substrate-binding protein